MVTQPVFELKVYRASLTIPLAQATFAGEDMLLMPLLYEHPI